MSRTWRFAREESGMEFVEWALVGALMVTTSSASFSRLSSSFDTALANVGERLVAVTAPATPGSQLLPPVASPLLSPVASPLLSPVASPLSPPVASPPPAPQAGPASSPPGGGSGAPQPPGGAAPVQVQNNTSILQSVVSQAAISNATSVADANRGGPADRPSEPGGITGGGVGGAVNNAVQAVSDAVDKFNAALEGIANNIRG
jgi:Flp pilus assembly pilin Flp